MIDAAGVDSWQVFLTVLWPFVQEWLKRSQSPMLAWVSDKTPAVNTMLSAAVALAATAGFHLSWNAANGGTLSIPPLLALGHVAGQWLGQHVVYQTAIKSPATQKAMLSALETIALKLGTEAIPKA